MHSSMDYHTIITAVEHHATDLFGSAESILPYHNLDHTRKVVAHVREIALHYQIDETGTFVVTVAGWFHDAGYLNGSVKEHELRGAGMADDFLKNYDIDKEIAGQVKACILATVLPQKPLNLLEEIVCDADLYHFGTKDLFMQDAFVKSEAEYFAGKKIDSDAWRKGTISFIESHSFHTGYCKDLLNPGKIENLEVLRKGITF
jgi:predicted metal-dependent HD superfamily phosphohydrolase